MSVGTIRIDCPAMAVNNTSRFPRAFTDRRAVTLYCTGLIQFPDVTFALSPDFNFMSCLVRFMEIGRWMVDPVAAFGRHSGGGRIWLSYPEEPVFREGSLMVAQPIPNIYDESWMELPGGKIAKVRCGLPRAAGEPQGIFGLGAYQYLVEPVTLGKQPGEGVFVLGPTIDTDPAFNVVEFTDVLFSSTLKDQRLIRTAKDDLAARAEEQRIYKQSIHGDRPIEKVDRFSLRQNQLTLRSTFHFRNAA